MKSEVRSRRRAPVPVLHLQQLKGLLELLAAVRRPSGGIHLVLGGPLESRRALQAGLLERLGGAFDPRALISDPSSPKLQAENLEPPPAPRQLLLTHMLTKADLSGGLLLPLLNLYRERLGAPRVHTVLWLEDEEDYLALQRQAPDLWTFRRRLYRAQPATDAGRQDAKSREWLVDALGKKLEAAHARYQWLTPDMAWGIAERLVDEIGLIPFWEHLQLWHDDPPDPSRLEPLAGFLIQGRGELPPGLESVRTKLLELDVFRHFAEDFGRHLPGLGLESPLLFSNPPYREPPVSAPVEQLPEFPRAAGGGLDAEALYTGMHEILQRGGVAWLTGPRGSGKTSLAWAYALVYADSYQGAVYLWCEAGLAAAIRKWFEAAGRTMPGERSDLEAVLALGQALSGRKVVLVLDDCRRVQDVRLCRQELSRVDLVVILSGELENELLASLPPEAPVLAASRLRGKAEPLSVREFPAGALGQDRFASSALMGETGQEEATTGSDTRSGEGGAAPVNPEEKAALRAEREEVLQRAEALWANQEYAAAVVLYQRCLEIDRQTGDRVNEGLDLLAMGDIRSANGEPARGQADLEASLEIARALGSKLLEAGALAMLSRLEWRRGNSAAALELAEEGVRIARETGNPTAETMHLIDLGSYYSERGALIQAVQVWNNALRIATEGGDKANLLIIQHNLGAAYLGEGQVRQAIDNLERAISLARELGDNRSEVKALALIAMAQALLGQVGAARARLKHLLSRARSLSLSKEVANIETVLALPELRTGPRKPKKKR